MGVLLMLRRHKLGPAPDGFSRTFSQSGIPSLNQQNGMNEIFTYDSGAQIPFYVDSQQGELSEHIVRHGGSLTSALQARIHLGQREGATMLPMDPDVPILRPAWVTESIGAGRMLPVYPYFDDPTQNLLRNLTVEHRDVAELLKARVGNTGDNVFNVLHRKFPHNSTQEWRALYENSEVVIQLALARIVPVNQEQLNRLVLPFFPQPIISTPVRQRFPRDVDMADRNNIPRVPTEEKGQEIAEVNYSFGIGNPQPVRRSASDVSFRPSSDAPAPTPARRQPRPYFIDDDNDEGEEENIVDDDDDEDYTDRGGLSQSEQPNREYQGGQKRIGRGVRLTDLDYERMAQFLLTLGREPGLPDWVDFWNMDPLNQTRSFNAWNLQYYLKKSEIAAARVRLRARERQIRAHDD